MGMQKNHSMTEEAVIPQGGDGIARASAAALEPESIRRISRALWEDNGFSTLEAQEHAHGVIASVLPTVDRTVLDLGCGNGLLARRIAGSGTATGIEMLDDRATRARSALDVVICGDMFDQFSRIEGVFDVVLLMPGRFAERLQKLLHSEPTITFPGVPLGDRLLVYAYGDWLERGAGLEALCHKAGMAGELAVSKAAEGVEAGIWRWK